MVERSEYLHTVERLEPDVAMIASGAGWASIAISLKRIADAVEKHAGSEADFIDGKPSASFLRRNPGYQFR